jgi:hypothetical protein
LRLLEPYEAQATSLEFRGIYRRSRERLGLLPR